MSFKIFQEGGKKKNSALKFCLSFFWAQRPIPRSHENPQSVYQF